MEREPSPGRMVRQLIHGLRDANNLSRMKTFLGIFILHLKMTPEFSWSGSHRGYLVIYYKALLDEWKQLQGGNEQSSHTTRCDDSHDQHQDNFKCVLGMVLLADVLQN